MYTGIGKQRTSTFILGAGATSGTVVTPPTGQRIVINGFSLSTATASAIVAAATVSDNDTKARWQADKQGAFATAGELCGFYLEPNEQVQIWGDGNLIYGNLYWEERK
jgi:hypothetical protein